MLGTRAFIQPSTRPMAGLMGTKKRDKQMGMIKIDINFRTFDEEFNIKPTNHQEYRAERTKNRRECEKILKEENDLREHFDNVEYTSVSLKKLVQFKHEFLNQGYEDPVPNQKYDITTKKSGYNADYHGRRNMTDDSQLVMPEVSRTRFLDVSDLLYELKEPMSVDLTSTRPSAGLGLSSDAQTSTSHGSYQKNTYVNSRYAASVPEREPEVLEKRNTVCLLPIGTVLKVFSRATSDVYTCAVLDVFAINKTNDNKMADNFRFNVPKDRLREKPFAQWTMQEVGRVYVKKLLAKEKKSSVLKLFESQQSVSGKKSKVFDPTDHEYPYVSSAKFSGGYVVCSRDSKFSEVVDSLQIHYRHQNNVLGDPDRDAYVWIDMISTDYSKREKLERNSLRTLAAAKEYEALGKTFLEKLSKHAVNAFDEVLLFVDDWIKPTFFTRAWCMYEIFMAIDGKQKISIIYNEEVEQKFKQLLPNIDSDFDTYDRTSNTFFTFLRNVDLSSFHSRSSDDESTLKKLLAAKLFKQQPKEPRIITDGYANQLEKVFLKLFSGIVVSVAQTSVSHLASNPEGTVKVLRLCSFFLRQAKEYEPALQCAIVATRILNKVTSNSSYAGNDAEIKSRYTTQLYIQRARCLLPIYEDKCTTPMSTRKLAKAYRAEILTCLNRAKTEVANYTGLTVRREVIKAASSMGLEHEKLQELKAFLEREDNAENLLSRSKFMGMFKAPRVQKGDALLDVEKGQMRWQDYFGLSDRQLDRLENDVGESTNEHRQSRAMRADIEVAKGLLDFAMARKIKLSGKSISGQPKASLDSAALHFRKAIEFRLGFAEDVEVLLRMDFAALLWEFGEVGLAEVEYQICLEKLKGLKDKLRGEPLVEPDILKIEILYFLGNNRLEQKYYKTALRQYKEVIRLLDAQEMDQMKKNWFWSGSNERRETCLIDMKKCYDAIDDKSNAGAIETSLKLLMCERFGT